MLKPLTQSCILAEITLKTFFHSVNLNFCQMVNSQSISIKLEATIHNDAFNIIKVFSSYYGDKKH